MQDIGEYNIWKKVHRNPCEDKIAGDILLSLILALLSLSATPCISAVTLNSISEDLKGEDMCRAPELEVLMPGAGFEPKMTGEISRKIPFFYFLIIKLYSSSSAANGKRS